MAFFSVAVLVEPGHNIVDAQGVSLFGTFPRHCLHSGPEVRYPVHLIRKLLVVPARVIVQRYVLYLQLKFLKIIFQQIFSVSGPGNSVTKQNTAEF